MSVTCSKCSVPLQVVVGEMADNPPEDGELFCSYGCPLDGKSIKERKEMRG